MVKSSVSYDYQLLALYDSMFRAVEALFMQHRGKSTHEYGNKRWDLYSYARQNLSYSFFTYFVAFLLVSLNE